MKIKINESGIRNIKDLSKKYDKSIIYGHMDLDGLTSSICAKTYLEKYGIKTIDFQNIQYGELEYSISKPNDNILSVLVDFSHGKPFMKIHTDHHQEQQSIKNISNQFRHSDSNADTWSSIISTSNIFSAEDIKIINMIDSAKYKDEKINPMDLFISSFKINKNNSSYENHIKLGIACNKLLLTYKNKPEFFKQIVMNANPSLESIYNCIYKIIQTNISKNEKRWITPEEIEQNSIHYYEEQKDKKIEQGTLEDIKNIKNGQSILIDDIIFQVGSGNISKIGSFDRYTAFKIYPESKYFIMLWDRLSMMQISKNPWNNENDINLGDLVLNDIFKNEIYNTLNNKKYNISLLTIKKVNEKKYNEETKSIGFNYDNLINLYPSIEKHMTEKQKFLIKKYMNWHNNDFMDVDNKDVSRALDMLSRFYVPLNEIILTNSGGHSSITNISGFNYLNEELGIRELIKDNKNPYTNNKSISSLSNVILKTIAKKIIKKLTNKGE